MRTHSRMQRGDAMRARIVVRVFFSLFFQPDIYIVSRNVKHFTNLEEFLLNHLMFFPYTELSLNCKNLKNAHQF